MCDGGESGERVGGGVSEQFEKYRGWTNFPPPLDAQGLNSIHHRQCGNASWVSSGKSRIGKVVERKDTAGPERVPI